ncbi:FAD-dependent monooxygenase [Micromonospora yasonensis]|uniref:FAD-dependent monooxygenase n=1 Tax=Micromonospora yasonensis TaxID=1128667 RepID=UPI0022316189|nr:FAD-dependent monooxygenase [Micromonospora yasonensis]MCW3840359.1 FAD-dependent monooxygenase [Micromonospora yasonensis]
MGRCGRPHRSAGRSGLVRIRADLVVGADGIRSTVRRLLWPDAAGPVRIGVTAWRGVTPAWDEDIIVAISWDRGAEFGMVPLADGRVYWFAAVNTEPADSAVDELAQVRARFGSWHDPIPALISATDTVLRDDLACLDEPLTTYVKGRVALLGDAAHAMTPNLGQGANQALEDAVVLAAVADRPDGLAAYDRQRRPRSQRVAKASRTIGRFGQQLDNPIAVASHGDVLAGIGSSVLRSPSRVATSAAASPRPGSRHAPTATRWPQCESGRC